MTKPKIVCLCGSTRFPEAFQEANKQKTLAGYIVLSVGFFGHSLHRSDECTREQKDMLNALHLAKIDMADEVLILNVGGYIGEGLADEIRYAESSGKTLRWWEPDKTPEAYR